MPAAQEIRQNFHGPRSIGLDGSYATCPLSCGDCVLPLMRQVGEEAAGLSEEEVRGRVDLIKEAGFRHIIFAASEPSLWSGLLPALKYIKDSGLTASFITNGLGLTTTFLQELKDGQLARKIIYSVDRMHVETIEERNRNGANFLTYEEVFAHLRAVGGFEKKVVVATTVGKSDLEELQTSSSPFLLTLRQFLLSQAELVAQWNINPLCGCSQTPTLAEYLEIMSRLQDDGKIIFPFFLQDRYPRRGDHWLYVETDGQVVDLYLTADGRVINYSIGTLVDTPNLVRKAQALGYLQ